MAISLSFRISARKSRLVEWGRSIERLRTRSFGRLPPWQMRIRPRLEQIAVGPGEQHGGVSIAPWRRPSAIASPTPARLSAHASPERTRRRQANLGVDRLGPSIRRCTKAPSSNSSFWWGILSGRRIRTDLAPAAMLQFVAYQKPNGQKIVRQMHSTGPSPQKNGLRATRNRQS